VYVRDYYAPNPLFCIACGLLPCFRVRYGLPPFLLPCFLPASYRSTPPSFNHPLPLVYLTRLPVPLRMFNAPFVDAPSDGPDSFLWRAFSPLFPFLLATLWYELFEYPHVVQPIADPVPAPSRRQQVHLRISPFLALSTSSTPCFETPAFSLPISRRRFSLLLYRSDAHPILIGGFLDIIGG
jgi:hypothetical protein